jgi:hypothetical protein
VPISRTRTSADIRREIEGTEQRLAALIERWQQTGHSRLLPADNSPSPAFLDEAEEVLRQQRGQVDRLHQLWIELAQASGQHAPE